MQKPTLVYTLRGHEDGVWCTAVSHNSQIIASSSFDTSINIWRAATGALICTLRDHRDAVLCLDLSQDGNMLLLIYVDLLLLIKITIYYLSGGGSLKNAENGGDIMSSDMTIRLWRLHDDQQGATICHNLARHLHMVRSVKFSPDGKTIASASDDWHAILWNVLSGEQLMNFSCHEGGDRCVAWSHDSKTLATGGCDKILRMWDDETGTQLEGVSESESACHTGGINGLVFSHKMDFVMSASGDHTIMA
jgi:WD40 repeat protein